jgi:hypothetical protein
MVRQAVDVHLLCLSLSWRPEPEMATARRAKASAVQRAEPTLVGPAFRVAKVANAVALGSPVSCPAKVPADGTLAPNRKTAATNPPGAPSRGWAPTVLNQSTQAPDQDGGQRQW